MTAKEIYESIDLSKLKKDTADKLRGLEKKTKGFTLKSDKVDAYMKKFYDTLKERKPDVLKNLKVEVKKVEEKVKKGEEAVVIEVQKVVGKKKVAKKTATPSAPKKRTTVATLAKAIRRKDEPWQSALKRAGEQMKLETKAAESATKTELEKLRKMIKSDPKFSDYPRTYGKQSKDIDMSKDAKTKALPAGKRVSKKGVKNQHGTSKGGRTYWENRDNRSDRNAPNYPTKVYLEYGGSLATQPYWLADNADALVSTETMGEMFEVGGQVFVPTEQLADNPNALVSTNTYAELFAQGGKLDITSMFEKGGTTTESIQRTKEKMINDLWDRKGYDISYLKELPLKQLKSLYDTEFYYEDEFFDKGGMVNLYYGGEQEDETLPASSEKDAANIAMRNGAEHYEFVPRMAKGGSLKRFNHKISDLHNDLQDNKETIEETQEFLQDIYGKDITYQDRLKYQYAKGGKLPKNITYYNVNEIKEYRLKNGDKIDPSKTFVHSGVYVSSTKTMKPKEEEFQQKLEFKKGGATNWKGEKINWKEDYIYIPRYEIEEVVLDEDWHNGKVIQGDYVVSGLYLPKSDRTKQLEKEMKARMMEKGGMVKASRTAMEIGALTGMNKNAIQKFVDDNNLDIERLYKFVLKSGLKQRMDMVSAIAGSPNNPIQKKIVKTFAK